MRDGHRHGCLVSGEVTCMLVDVLQVTGLLRALVVETPIAGDDGATRFPLGGFGIGWSGSNLIAFESAPAIEAVVRNPIDAQLASRLDAGETVLVAGLLRLLKANDTASRLDSGLVLAHVEMDVQTIGAPLR